VFSLPELIGHEPYLRNAWIKTASTEEQASASSISGYANKAKIANAIRAGCGRLEP
jgi:hypothetical protein